MSIRTASLTRFALLFTLSFTLGASAHAMGRARAPAAIPTPTPAVSPGTVLEGASSCKSSDPNHICLGIKMVSYTQNGTAVLPKDQAIALTDRMSKVWAQCNIGFQLESYQSIDPTTVGLDFDTNWKSSGDTVRSAFNDSATFLVVSVGVLTGSTIAVTEMPGAGVYGTLVEKDYVQNELTVGHEIGHYQGLYHISDTQNLMNPYIGPNTRALSADQCATARKTDYANWQAMMRN